MDYAELLNRAREKSPEKTVSNERFEIPRVRGHIQGVRTVISNFYQIASALHREPAHLLKFVLKELATPGDLKKNAAIIGSKVPATRINQKIEDYAYAFVFCPVCNRPDTRIVKEKTRHTLKCQACGAVSPIRKRL
ncbi:MAG: translation initiation factor IF-2 subunit beta [DPANN group archaeon]|nr:translation initiation factor IF-2 subunit beta [DPANN group archaeon]